MGLTHTLFKKTIEALQDELNWCKFATYLVQRTGSYWADDRTVKRPKRKIQYNI